VTLRVLAVVIVLAAILDPVLTRETTERAVVAVQFDRRDSATARDVMQVLADRFDVISGPFAAAAATVVVDPRNVRTDVPSQGPVFAVVDTNAPLVSIATHGAPGVAALNGALRIPVSVGVPSSFRGTLALAVTHQGVTLDSLTVIVDRERATIDTVLTVVPTVLGLWPLQLRAALVATDAVAEHDLVVEVSDQRQAVLFFDRRPSYQSTFVRRAVEADARFRVTHRVLTSRDQSRGSGAPPPSLADAAALDVFDVIVVGAPDALTSADQTALERFLRVRGGAVVLLQDSVSDAAPLRALTGVPSWREARGARVAIPSSRPAGSRVIASDTVAGPTLWVSSVGAGQLYVSGLLDQWRVRDDPLVGFSRFWPALIAEAGSTVAAPIEILTPTQLTSAGRVVPLSFWVRETAPLTVVVSADSGRVLDTLAVLGEARTGYAHALWRTPRALGAVDVQVSAGVATRRVPGLVVSEVRRDGAPDPVRRARWIAATGGTMVAPRDLALLPEAITRAIGSPRQQLPWYPMRSPWWILPLALLLGAEWYLRRRRALP
jgi:hypothetical protein